MLTIGTNSFVTLTEANDYLSEKFGADNWFTLSLANREKLLVTAFRWLVSIGVSKTSTAEMVKWAQIELAWWIYQYIDEMENREALYAGGVRSFTLSKWSERLEKSELPERIKNMIVDDIGYGGYFPDYNRELEN